MNFLERALPLIKLGLYVIPVAPPTPGVKDTGKNPLIGDWPNNSTINRKQVEAWYASWPDANVGCVANGKCMLDDDRGDLKEKYEAETGNKFPSQTFSVRTSVKSTGMRGWHFYFNSTVRTIMAGNRKKAGVFDFQCENKHCVGPGTVHWTGAVYKAVGPRAPIADMPDELCAWIERVADAEKPRTAAAGGPLAHEDWDCDAWMEFYADDVFTCAQDGDWWVSSICPRTYRRGTITLPKAIEDVLSCSVMPRTWACQTSRCFPNWLPDSIWRVGVGKGPR